MMSDERIANLCYECSQNKTPVWDLVGELLDEIKRLRERNAKVVTECNRRGDELSRYRTPQVDQVTFEPRPDEVSHEQK